MFNPMTDHKVSVKLDSNAFMPVRAHATDAGADLRTPIDLYIPAKGCVVVGTGVHVETPPGFVTLIKSKSGLNVKHSIITEGVVDEGYSGEIFVKLYNLGNKDYAFQAGDKIAQILIMPVHYFEFVQADSISSGDRGDNGFGSTGQ